MELCTKGLGLQTDALKVECHWFSRRGECRPVIGQRSKTRSLFLSLDCFSARLHGDLAAKSSEWKERGRGLRIRVS
ncbi:unnamed protein product [Gadus morhua 'NCC']